MNDNNDHERMRELLAGYALDSLDRADAQELASHIAQCAECEAELVRWREAASLLSYSVDVAEPRAEVRARLLEQIEELERDKAPRVLQLPDADSTRMSSWQLWKNPAPAALLAACLVLVVLAISLFIVWRRERALTAELAALSQRIEAQKKELDRSREISDLLLQPDARAVSLSGTPTAPKAQARIIVADKSSRVLLVASNLPVAPEGKAYQLWFIVDGKPIAGHTFTTDPLGSAFLREEFPAGARAAKVFAVTLEPASGVVAPTGAMYLLSPTS